MPEFNRPEKLPEWASEQESAEHIEEPPQERKQDGWDATRPAHPYFNWWMRRVWEWLGWWAERSDDHPGSDTGVAFTGPISGDGTADGEAGVSGSGATGVHAAGTEFGVHAEVDGVAGWHFAATAGEEAPPTGAQRPVGYVTDDGHLHWSADGDDFQRLTMDGSETRYAFLMADAMRSEGPGLTLLDSAAQGPHWQVIPDNSETQLLRGAFVVPAGAILEGLDLLIDNTQASGAANLSVSVFQYHSGGSGGWAFTQSFASNATVTEASDLFRFRSVSSGDWTESHVRDNGPGVRLGIAIETEDASSYHIHAARLRYRLPEMLPAP